ncbi:MAG: helix-turn-helix transcriptional regulator [Rhodobacteraceae bacterium]|nr:helix-turn-helix transcriptional regulator [Paracoccaceae bacterium]
MTQVQLAETLGIQQATVAKYERQSDLLLSTLTSYVRAMGGNLKLMVEFPGKAPVALEGLGDTGSPVVGAARREKSDRSRLAPDHRTFRSPSSHDQTRHAVQQPGLHPVRGTAASAA